MQYAEMAARVFPYSRFVRTYPAYFAMQYLPPSEETVDLISTVLRTDPFSADLTNGLALHAFGINNNFLANNAWKAFVRLVPNSPRAKQVGAALEALQ